MTYHRVLERQLKKASRHTPDNKIDLDLLCELVSQAYEEMESNQRRREHATQLMSAELTSHKDHLEEQVQLRTRQLRETTKIAQEASRTKSEFLATMSHEIRTPINGIVGMVELLGRTQLSAEQADLVGTLVQSVETLQSVINDILDFSKIENGALTLEPISFNLHDLVDSVADTFAPAAERKSLSIYAHYSNSLPERFKGDAGRIRQMLNNLVSNAIKFTETGHVLIKVQPSPAHSGADPSLPVVRCSVQDTGIGIPADKHMVIFERFTQADASTTRRFGGTGLGLAIVREMAFLMEGNIGLESEPDVGSIFWFDIPLPVENGETGRHTAVSHVPQGTRVLVVEDNPTNETIFRENLEFFGLQPTVVTTGEEALALLRQQPDVFPIIILDHLLPDMSSTELVAQIRYEPLVPENVAIICVSSLAQRGDVKQMERDGVDGYLVKPAGSAVLYQMLSATYGRPRKGTLLTRHMLSEVRPKVEALKPAAGAEGKPLRVLVAEDDIVNQKIVSRYLSNLELECVIAENGTVALEKAMEEDFDIIFMDMRMPGMDGIEASYLIRFEEQQKNKRHVPIVALTANATKEDQEACLAAGMDAFLSKPVTLEKFRAMIDTLLKNKEA